MARDLSGEVRDFVVRALNGGNPVKSLLGDGRAYGPSAPADPPWPFIRVDLPVIVPERNGCGDGSRYTFRVHGFAKGDDETNAAALGGGIASQLDELAGDMDVDPPATVTDTVWTGSQVFRDTASVDGWHSVVSVIVRVSG